jgi:hypothetical protein
VLFVCCWEEVRGVWGKLRNEELRDLFCSLNVIREHQGAGHVARMGGKVQCARCFGGETLGKEATWKTKTDLGG